MVLAGSAAAAAATRPVPALRASVAESLVTGGGALVSHRGR